MSAFNDASRPVVTITDVLQDNATIDEAVLDAIEQRAMADQRRAEAELSLVQKVRELMASKQQAVAKLFEKQLRNADLREEIGDLRQENDELRQNDERQQEKISLLERQLEEKNEFVNAGLDLAHELTINAAAAKERAYSQKKLTCKGCKKRVTNAKPSLLQHVSTGHCFKPFFECTKCNLGFSLTADYKKHFKNAHDGDMSRLKKNHLELEPLVKNMATKLFPAAHFLRS